MRVYHYHVSCNWQTEKQIGQKSCVIRAEKPLRTPEAVQELRRTLKRHFAQETGEEVEGVVILAWQQLKTEIPFEWSGYMFNSSLAGLAFALMSVGSEMLFGRIAFGLGSLYTLWLTVDCGLIEGRARYLLSKREEMEEGS